MDVYSNESLEKFFMESGLESNQPINEIKDGNLLLHRFLFQDYNEGLLFLSGSEDGDCIAIPAQRIEKIILANELAWPN